MTENKKRDSQTTMADVLRDKQALEGFSRMRLAMVITNPAIEDNPIVYVNEAFERTTGFARSAAIGRNCRFLQGEDTDKRSVDALRNAIEHGEDITVDITNYRANGEKFLNRLIVSAIPDDKGKPLYFLGIQRELGHRETDGTRLNADQQLKKLVHRVRQDLGVILENISKSREDLSVPADFEALERRLETLQLCYEEMELLDSSNVRDWINLGAILSRVGTSIAHHGASSGIRYTQNVESLDVSIDTATRAALIISEVLTNAFQHAFKGLSEGFIELRVTRLAAGGFRITVTDDGVGIPNNVTIPNETSLGGSILNDLLTGLEGSMNVIRGAAGTVVTVDVPAGHDK
ncbi:PAS domain-containing protein [Primorskyibacter sp. S187A]|uniref:PAS domain-containing protein n=1 Tax=Primorskyibacter sp. S187A TaxID=3415130 RepID=UPI003C7C3FCD